jgi:prepilin-type N-terminal cleavage/methylation domain-containing protein
MRNFKKDNLSFGFTLIELMVTIGVFVLLSTVVLVNYRSVDNSLVLQNTAHQMGLIIRKAQVSGLSVVGAGSGTIPDFPTYGANFNLATPTMFIFFADFDGNGVFSGTCPGVTCELVQRYNLPKNYTIKNLLGNNKSASPGSTPHSLNITFTRPLPDATMKETASSPVFADSEIVVQSLAGATRTIVIWKTGQLSVE